MTTSRSTKTKRCRAPAPVARFLAPPRARCRWSSTAVAQALCVRVKWDTMVMPHDLDPHDLTWQEVDPASHPFDVAPIRRLQRRADDPEDALALANLISILITHTFRRGSRVSASRHL